MTIELNPVGIKCNLACTYCYETEMRTAGNYGPKDYDLERMQGALLSEMGTPNGSWTMHGGEPFLMPVEDVEAMWRWGHERGQTLGVQTNGTLITDRHIALAKQYGVHIGVSIDGPGEMNDLRWQGTLEKTRESTAASEKAIDRLRARGVATSVIVVLHNLNVAKERRATFKLWIKYLDAIGVNGVRFHPMEVDHKAFEHLPTMEEYIEFYRDMRQFMATLPTLRIDIIEDIRALVRGKDNQVTCTWAACDSYTTAAVQGIDGQGNKTNCGRTNKDGVAHPKARTAGYERYLALYHTPYESGGCSGCRFFSMCKGQCPGEGIDGDWRNRSSYCKLYMALFEDMERELVEAGEQPVSLSSARETVEQVMLQHWAAGKRINIASALSYIKNGLSVSAQNNEHMDVPHGDEHGDHTDTPLGQEPHGDQHGDTRGGCHGDEHGDHTDKGN